MIGTHYTDAEITMRQRLLECLVFAGRGPRTWGEYMRSARWWELEARRGYASSANSLRYARNMEWAAELAREFGPGTWLELLKRSGHRSPVAR